MAYRDYTPMIFRRMKEMLNTNLTYAAIEAKKELQTTLSKSGRRGFGKSTSIAKRGGGSIRVKKIAARLKTRAEARQQSNQGVVFGAFTIGTTRGAYANVTGKKAIGGVSIRYGRVSAKTGKRSILGLTYPSRPGQPPHRQTGRLHGSINYRLNRSTSSARVGTNVVYARPLEEGTRKMAPRPWMRPTMRRIMPRLTTIIYRGFIR